LDANVIIRLLESDANSRATLRKRLSGRGPFLTSELSLIECRSHPLRKGNHPLLTLYDSFFNSSDIHLCPLDRQIVDQATELCATTKLRVPDALHLASAVANGATHFCTGDLHFSSISLIAVEIF
jgi:predicted nucleic acid-binding protein